VEEKIQNLKNNALATILAAENREELANLRSEYLGKAGKINEITREIPTVEQEKRKMIGQLLNDARAAIENVLTEQETIIRNHTQEAWFDPTVPGIKPKRGHTHLVTEAIDEITDIFGQIGFVRVRYPEVDWDLYAFEALNMPKDHPARDEWETFFIDVEENKKMGKTVLTPHTSNGQVREMERLKNPPIRMINIAKCYRRQSDISHVPMFHQFEGLVVDEGISIVHLKGTLDYFARNFFGPTRKTRLRPYHFQFTEPSFEVDITCGMCDGRGCKLCKAGWLELGGAGMVHPNVLKAGGIDATRYSGFAFGWGVERTFMMKSGLQIGDIRLLYSSDLRFLRQF
jgi:phenylalanyl-tRNA synthetase alpha chain